MKWRSAVNNPEVERDARCHKAGQDTSQKNAGRPGECWQKTTPLHMAGLRGRPHEDDPHRRKGDLEGSEEGTAGGLASARRSVCSLGRKLLVFALIDTHLTVAAVVGGWHCALLIRVFQTAVGATACTDGGGLHRLSEAYFKSRFVGHSYSPSSSDPVFSDPFVTFLHSFV